MADGTWMGMHGAPPKADEVEAYVRFIGEGLAPLGINALILETTWNGYRFQSSPGLDKGGLDAAGARVIADACRANGIRPIPMYNCLGHQSWGKSTAGLLTTYPEFDETPGKHADNDGIYGRSWCPLHPEVNSIVFGMMDELIDAFGADAFHVGMDEVFIIADADCPRCAGRDPAELYAKAVNDYHGHLVAKRGLEMMMWGDRLIDAAELDYGKWEASEGGTAPAVDKIPSDVVICDWHYEPREDYPSVRYFQQKGLRVWPAGWYRVDPTKALIACARSDATERMLGYLFTTWGIGHEPLLAALKGEAVEGSDKRRERVESMARAMRECAPLI